MALVLLVRSRMSVVRLVVTGEKPVTLNGSLLFANLFDEMYPLYCNLINFSSLTDSQI